jgi:hypothetical protein
VRIDGVVLVTTPSIRTLYAHARTCRAIGILDCTTCAAYTYTYTYAWTLCTTPPGASRFARFDQPRSRPYTCAYHAPVHVRVDLAYRIPVRVPRARPCARRRCESEHPPATLSSDGEPSPGRSGPVGSGEECA